MVVVLNMYL